MRLLIGLFLFIGFSAWAVEVQVPALSSPVMDEAAMLSPAERQDLSGLAYEIFTNNGPQITILTVNDLQGHAIEDFSIRVAEKWQLGLKEKGNGLLITVAKEERQMRIEVGEGIEGEITDYDANRYIREILTPAFRSGNFHGGLRYVMLDIGDKFGVKANGARASPTRMAGRRPVSPLESLLPVFFIILVIGNLFLRKRRGARGIFSGAGIAGAGYLMLPGIGLAAVGLLFIFGLIFGIAGINNILYAMAAHRGGRGGFGGGGFGGGGFGGGGWGGGGGGFSGGGASGGW